MASLVRPQTIPQCTACLRSYLLDTSAHDAIPALGGRQHIRGKKKLANNSASVHVRLRKDVKTFGRKGAIVPIPRGQMRNEWFPRGIAAYVTLPEMKTLRLKNTAMDRDFQFGVKWGATTSEAMAPWQKDLPSDVKALSNEELRNASAFQKKVEVERLSPERSVELLEIFVGPRLDFYRQPIIEEKEKEIEAEAPPESKKAPRMGRGAAADLLAARTPEPGKAKDQRKDTTPQAIYGSVSTHDVLLAVRATMERNDEATRVVLHEEDIQFVDLPEAEGSEAGKVKHVGDFVVEIKVKGLDVGIRRTVKVVPQEL